jgi:two-component sensor histidine kinase
MVLPIRVLYIDDDSGLGRLLQKAMVGKGIHIDHVETGDAAVAALGAGHFDIVALDHNLISETGLDVMQKFSALERVPPVIYVTGSEDARTAVAALKAGAVDYVWKDVQGHYRELLVEAIAGALAREKLEREREEALREVFEGKQRAEMLLAEVNHRVANSLSLVAALAHLQANAAPDESARAALKEIQTRISAIAGVHRRLYTSSDVRVVQFGAYLRGLIEELAAALNTESRHTIRVDAEEIDLATDKVVSLGVILTELVTNSMKYAFPDGQDGTIVVAARRLENGLYRICVEDDGIGWSGGGHAQGSGLGSRIIAAMARNLNSTVVYEGRSSGTRASLEFEG